MVTMVMIFCQLWEKAGNSLYTKGDFKESQAPYPDVYLLKKVYVYTIGLYLLRFKEYNF
jgi:hypothetical protein